MVVDYWLKQYQHQSCPAEKKQGFCRGSKPSDVVGYAWFFNKDLKVDVGGCGCVCQEYGFVVVGSGRKRIEDFGGANGVVLESAIG